MFAETTLLSSQQYRMQVTHGRVMLDTFFHFRFVLLDRSIECKSTVRIELLYLSFLSFRLQTSTKGEQQRRSLQHHECTRRKRRHSPSPSDQTAECHRSRCAFHRRGSFQSTMVVCAANLSIESAAEGYARVTGRLCSGAIAASETTPDHRARSALPSSFG